jgi:hypothetical protein
MIVRKIAIPRRAFLRGAGTVLALPFLDAMVPAFAASASRPTRPTRMMFIEVPNGIMMDKWTPATEGANFELTPVLEPVARFRDRFLVISGLDQNEARRLEFESGGEHPRACTSWLTGAHALMTAGANQRAGISVDQVAAKEFGKETQLASLEVALERGGVVGQCESAYSCAYSSTVSWQNETTPLPMETRPRVVFERLFGDGGGIDPKVRLARLETRRSILDAVTEDVGRLRVKLAPADRGKMEQYLDAVRDVERRIQKATAQSDRKLPEMTGAMGVPNLYSEHFKLLADLQVLAWQTDMTRVGTFQLGREMGNLAYPELGFGDTHHSVTHHLGDPEKIAKVIQINIFHTKLLSYYLDRLQSTPDGDGSLLDHAIVLYGGALSDGNQHLFTNLPILLVAGGVAGIRGGQHVRYRAGTPMTNLFLTMLDKAGVPHVDRLGDSTGRLSLPTA